MEKAPISSISSSDKELIFKYFPSFAKFIRENHLIEYIQEQIRLSIELDLPIMKHIRHIPADQLLEMGIPTHTEFLMCAENNTLKALLKRSLSTWENDEMDILSRTDIATEDITLGTYIRKKSMLKFLPLYTTDHLEIIEIVKEIDAYSSEAITVSTLTYINILKETIRDKDIKSREFLQQKEEQLLEAQALSGMGSYSLDIESEQIEATPEFYKIFATTPENYNRSSVAECIHPADYQRVMNAREKAIAENSIFDCEYRIVIGDAEKVIWARGVIYIKDDRKIMRGTVMDVTERKHIIQRVQRSEELYKQAQAMSHIGNWTWDLKNNKLTWSEELYRIYGLEPGLEISYELVGSFNHPEDAPTIAMVMDRAKQTHEPYDFNYRIVLPDGLTKIVNAKGNVLTSDGIAYKMLGTVQDITEKQLWIEKLQKSEERYKQAQAMSRIGNWEWSIKENRIEWTDELYRIYGIEITDRPIDFDLYAAYIHPDDKEMVENTIQNSITNKVPYDIYHRIVLENGEVRSIHGKGDIMLDSNKEVVKLYGTAQDITKEYLAEQELKNNREFIQKITNVSPSLLASYNVHSGNYSFINQAFETVLGYKAEQIYEGGVSFFLDIIHPDDIGSLMDENAKALAEANKKPPVDGNEMIFEFEYRMRHKDGQYRWFHTYSTIFDRDQDGFVEHVLNVSVDITNQKEAEHALFQKNLELSQSNSSLEEFAYVASHDLKEPLRKISTFGDLILKSNYDTLTADGRNYLDKIITSAKRMQTMINDLMSLSIISGNKKFEFTDLNTVLTDVMGLLEHNIRNTNAVINYKDLPVINIEASQFRQLFQNLLSNSLKFSRKDVAPEISIRTSFLTPADALTFGFHNMKRYLKIEFEDNGIGFENEYANKIFTIFQRLYSKSEYEGNGIGLAICRKVVENHKGIIFATGTLNKGSLFTIIIPC